MSTGIFHRNPSTVDGPHKPNKRLLLRWTLAARWTEFILGSGIAKIIGGRSLSREVALAREQLFPSASSGAAGRAIPVALVLESAME